MDSQLVWIVIGLVLFFAFLLFLRSRLKPEYPYYKNPYFISYAERAFFKLLQLIVGDRYYIFTQVSLNSLLRVDKQGKEWYEYFNKIKQKSVDFVLVEKESFNPVLIIELDDLSHTLPHRQRRDEFLEGALREASIPLLRIKNRRSYNLSEVKEQINHYLFQT